MAVVAGDDAGSYRLPMATGCPTCRGRGYSGRIPLFEALAIGTEERGAIRQAHAEEVLQRLAREKDIPTLLSIGLRRVLAGETTLDEVLGVIEDGRL